MQQMPITRFESALCRSSLLPDCVREAQTSAFLAEHRTICTQLRSSMTLAVVSKFDMVLFVWLIQRTPITRFKSASRCYNLRCLPAPHKHKHWQLLLNLASYANSSELWLFRLIWYDPMNANPSAIHWSNFVAWLRPIRANIGNHFERRIICKQFQFLSILILVIWSNERQSRDSSRQFVVF